jgi:signal transduction histidine kinase
MRTLFGKLCLALLAILGLAGTAFLVVERFSTRLYYEELTQRLNAPIAMYVTGERQLMTDGDIDRDSLESLASQAMVINPTVEVYLLDVEGRILGHALPPETVLTDRVDLEPLRRLLAGDGELPIRGTDPRSPTRAKVFSVAEVMDGDALEGYLYVVLGGQRYDELATDIRGSYVRKLTVVSMVAVLVVALGVGLLVFGLLTRRLTRLRRVVGRFADAGFREEAAVTWPASRRRDEIDQLGESVAAMSDRIVAQFRQLKETDRLRRELITNVSHDLRTPLASIQGYVDTLYLKDAELGHAERRRYLQTTRKHTRHLARLVGDLFELSRLESASVEPVFEQFSLAELLQDVAQEFELEAESRGVIIDVDTTLGGAQVHADIALIQRVLENLIRNALKFTPRGGRIGLRLEPQPRQVAITIADTGCGITEDDLPQIFDRYFRRADAAPQEFPSTGLGLAIVKRILDLHGSRISVTSEVDVGTRFEFTLPIAA